MFSDPIENVKRLGLVEGNRAVDFGSGSGAYSLAMARQVGVTGLVYAVEVQQVLLERLAREVKTQRINNLKIVHGDVDKIGGTGLRDGVADLVLLANILFQSDAKYTMILEAKRVLRAGGRLAVVEWSGSFGNLGPAEDRVVHPEEVKEIGAQAEMTFLNDFPAGEHHYGLMFQKNSRQP
ncbi:methyltransferase domain-containing protein [Candidatus Nomurabacteria bacterium]|nr:methyltransferase domain-containing protein [Candidatus Nomurabacteria bacterium]